MRKIGSVPIFRVADRIALGFAFAGVCALGIATLVLMVDIALRKSVGFSITGTIDMLQLAQMFCVFFALPAAFLRESHVGVEFTTDWLPPRARAAVKALAALLSAALLAAILWYSLGQAAIQLRQEDRSVTLGIPMLAYWAPLLVGSALSTAAALLVAARHARDATRRPA